MHQQAAQALCVLLISYNWQVPQEERLHCICMLNLMLYVHFEGNVNLRSAQYASPICGNLEAFIKHKWQRRLLCQQYEGIC